MVCGVLRVMTTSCKCKAPLHVVTSMSLKPYFLTSVMLYLTCRDSSHVADHNSSEVRTVTHSQRAVTDKHTATSFSVCSRKWKWKEKTCVHHISSSVLLNLALRGSRSWLSVSSVHSSMATMMQRAALTTAAPLAAATAPVRRSSHKSGISPV